jgi:predicted AlkP superfamily pyrophosphatase or phosphodiesterase
MPGFAGVPRPAADIVLTPKPDHGPDGKLLSLCWSQPAELVPRLFAELGPFPLMNYWGPLAGIASSQWIAKSAAIVWREHSPQLQWVYVPHLDYDLQRFGPDSPQAKQAVRDAAMALDPLLGAVLDGDGRIALLSEYSMTPVQGYVQPNRILADAGLLLTRPTEDGELIDYERSAAFAMVDHQIAHVYGKDTAGLAQARRALDVPGVDLSEPMAHLRHRRCGDLILRAQPDAWFDCRWWTDPAKAPKFAKGVDIHRKPGYDPLELFWDRAANGVSQNPALVRGSHGRVSQGQGVWVTQGVSRGPDVIRALDVAAAITEMIE